MKLCPLILLGLMFALSGSAGPASPELAQMKNIYLLPMANGLDQHLANQLTRTGRFTIVTEPRLADAVFTERLGEDFEELLTELYPPETPPAETPQPESPPAESPQPETPQAATPPAEAPPAAPPPAETPSAETPPAEAPPAKAPSAEAPQVEALPVDAPEDEKKETPSKKKNAQKKEADEQLSAAVWEESKRPRGTWNRGRGTVFLVDPKSHKVLWSAYERPRRSTADEINRTAGKIVELLQKDLSPR
ncbi:MAG: hypothetical protein ACRD7E_03530 [Bryobacteraceae bacterium]